MKGIDPVKVDRLALIAPADQVLPQFLILGIIHVREVPDLDGAVFSGRGVCLRVSGCGFQIWGKVDLAAYPGFSLAGERLVWWFSYSGQ